LRKTAKLQTLKPTSACGPKSCPRLLIGCYCEKLNPQIQYLGEVLTCSVLNYVEHVYITMFEELEGGK